MNTFLTILFSILTITLQAQTTINLPYNPDGNADGFISTPDLQDLLANYGLEFVADELLYGDSSLFDVITQLMINNESLQTQIIDLQNSIPFVDSSMSKIFSIECIDMGIGFSCSPQGGLCSEITLETNIQGRYILSTTCSSEFNPSLCTIPNWRKFKVEGVNLTGVTNAFFHYGNVSPTGYGSWKYKGTYFEGDCLSVSDSLFYFWVGYYEDPGGYSSVGLPANSAYSQSPDDLWFPVSFKINNKIVEAPFRLGFSQQ